MLPPPGPSGIVVYTIRNDGGPPAQPRWSSATCVVSRPALRSLWCDFEQTAMTLDFIPTIISTRNEPDPAGVTQAFARIGYRIEEAVADIVDNSVDASASVVLIRFFRNADSIERVVIADDGLGMTNDNIDHCMQFGAYLEHKESDLGKYGIGLKAASFSQCRSLSLVTPRQDKPAGVAGRSSRSGRAGFVSTWILLHV
jgi:hypothetical protein